jgi:5-methylcytosine-specific restriction endonuclease McrA
MRRACWCGRVRPCANHPPTTLANGSTWAWRKVRAQVLARDRHVCQLRLPGCTVIADCVDHTVPSRHGGSDDPSNLRAACGHCNRVKGGR